MSNRRTQLRVGYIPGFGSPGSFGETPDAGLFSKVLTTREGGQSHIEPIFAKEDFRDCTTQYLLDKIVLHRYARLTLDLEVDRDLLSAVYYIVLGQGSPASSTMLGPSSFVLPRTAMVVGFAGDENSGILLGDAVGESFKIQGQIENKLQVQLTMVGRGDLAVLDGYDFPDCETITPLRFDQDTSISVNSVERVQDTRGFDLSVNNKLPLRDLPYTLGVVDISRPLERGDQRDMTFNWNVLGREGDTLAAAATSVPPTHYPFSLGIGSPGVTISAEDAIVEPQGNTLQGWSGEVSLATLQLMLTPTRIPGDNNTPLHAVQD
jgi:hypothetical protein